MKADSAPVKKAPVKKAPVKKAPVKKAPSSTRRSATLAGLRSRLEEFVRRNPECQLIENDGAFSISNPWGDSTLLLSCGESEVAEALQPLRLPPLLSAIYHTDLRDLEVIWGTVSATSDLLERAFNYEFGNENFRCEFAPPSDRLSTIARAFQPIAAPTLTNHRNLGGIAHHQRTVAKRPELATRRTVRSFWIRGIDLDEESIEDFVSHINFYLVYLDRQSPRILVHNTDSSDAALGSGKRFPTGEFPLSVRAARLDPYMLSLWNSAHAAADPFRKFLHFYQIIEYAAFYHLETSTVQAVRRTLSSPDALENVDRVTHRLLEILSEDKRQDTSKINAVLSDNVEPEIVWDQLAVNLNYFAKPVEFDGGFSMKSFLNADWGAGDFEGCWIPKWPDALRQMRNALVHARERRMANVILPTRANHRLLTPWLGALSVSAGQLMLTLTPD